MLWKPRQIVIEAAVSASFVTTRIRDRWPEIPAHHVERIRDFTGDLGRQDLALAEQRGQSIKKCPGTTAYTCCDYYVLNLGIGCRLGCSYCFLNHYMNTPFTIYANTERVIDDARRYFGAHPGRHFRVGSGEFIDSLDFESLAGVHELLVPALSELPNVTFELKTKSDRVDSLLELDHHGRTVISWSVNPEIIREREETLTPSLLDRLAAASRVVEAGYQVGFHFDPIIHFPGWESAYDEVVSALFDLIPSERIAWISLGALRFHPDLKPVIEARFPNSRLTTGELIRGLDGKFRYFITIRQQLFARLNDFIRQQSPDVPIYLCMEGRDIAREAGVSGL
jgi:spore photoproduct lyase